VSLIASETVIDVGGADFVPEVLLPNVEQNVPFLAVLDSAATCHVVNDRGFELRLTTASTPALYFLISLLAIEFSPLVNPY
jgi:hypothetical protein